MLSWAGLVAAAVAPEVSLCGDLAAASASAAAAAVVVVVSDAAAVDFLLVS